MTNDRRNRSWFALLRRDRLVFAFAAALLVVMQLLQPRAAGPASALDAGASICRFTEASSLAPGGDRGSDAHDCQHCVAGPCAGLATAARDDAAGSVVPGLRRDARTPAYRTEPLRSDLAGAPPPAIRAPPSVV